MVTPIPLHFIARTTAHPWCKPVKAKDNVLPHASSTYLSTVRVENRMEMQGMKIGAGDVDSRRPEEQIQLGAIICQKNGKGCDIGYAPAANSCEEVNSVDTCTVAAL
jgi:hypothetical protein